MSDIRRRVKKAEHKMSLSKEPITITVTTYGRELPMDRTDGNITIHYTHNEKTKLNETERFEGEL